MREESKSITVFCGESTYESKGAVTSLLLHINSLSGFKRVNLNEVEVASCRYVAWLLGAKELSCGDVI